MDIPSEALELNKEIEGILPEAFGKTYIQRLAYVYGVLWSRKYGMKPMISYGQIGKVSKELIEFGFNEYQIAYLMIMYFDWAGANGDDDFIKRRLESSTHSIFLLKAQIDSMRAYSKNRLRIDPDNTEEVKVVVDKHLKI